MDLDLINNIVNGLKSNNFVHNFMKELQNYLENNISTNIYERENITMLNPTYNGNKIITKYRDKMLIERLNILNNYASRNMNNDTMYYIFDRNSKDEHIYNLCICEKGKSSSIIEVNTENLPNETSIGSVLRKSGDNYILDEKATNEVSIEINNMNNELVEEQKEYLQSKRIDGHIYEVSENDEDRVWLFDVTNKDNEGFEEIDFPEELLNDCKEGDLFIYKNGEYQKY